MTRAELEREGVVGTVSEGAAYLALAREGDGLAFVEASVVGGRPGGVVLRLEEVSAALGQSLAATPALAWAAAIDLLAEGADRISVVGPALDGDSGTVTFTRSPRDR